MIKICILETYVRNLQILTLNSWGNKCWNFKYSKSGILDLNVLKNERLIWACVNSLKGKVKVIWKSKAIVHIDRVYEIIFKV